MLLVACGSGGDDASEGTPTPRPAPDDATAIRGVDFEEHADAVALLEQFGSGRIDTPGVVFVDLTGDQREEAIVPVTSDGTLGNIAYLVFTMKSGDAVNILTRTMDRSTASGLHMDIEAGVLTETVGIFGAEDPLCCPSELRLTTFRWDGTELQVEREETAAAANPPKQ